MGLDPQLPTLNDGFALGAHMKRAMLVPAVFHTLGVLRVESFQLVRSGFYMSI